YVCGASLLEHDGRTRWADFHRLRAVCFTRLRRMRSKAGEYGLEHWQHSGHTPRPDNPIPHRLELLPAGCIADVAQHIERATLLAGTSEDRRPLVKIPIGTPVPRFQGICSHSCWTKYDVSSVEQVPIVAQHSALL